MTTEIIIATRNRFDKLCKTIDSIDLDKFNVRVFFDGDESGLELFKKKYYKQLYAMQETEVFFPDGLSWLFFKEHKGAVWCRNHTLKLMSYKERGNYIYATDDMIFKPDSIESAEKEFKQAFPDNDGVLGFRQTGNHKFHQTGVAMVGINFLKKYPHQWLFYPGYFHFACQEILWHATKIGKFAIGSEAVMIEHMNPIVNSQYMDQTHADARIHKTKDHQLMLERKKTGLIWGYNDFAI